MSQLLKILMKKLSNHFFLYAVIVVFYLRLFLPVFLKEPYEHVSEELASLIILGFIFMLGLVFVVKKRVQQEYVFQSGFELSLGLLFVALCLSVKQSVYYAGSLSCVMHWAGYLLYFYILVDVFKEKEARKTFTLYFIGGILAVSFFAILEWFLPSSSYLHGTDKFVDIKLPYRRVGSLFGGPNLLAGFYILILPLMGALYLIAKEAWQKISMAIVIFVCAVGFLMTLSLLCTVNLFIVTIVFTSVISRHWFNKTVSRKLFLGIGLGVVVFLIVIVWMRNDFSSSSRVEYLRSAWLILKDHLWWGTGADTFRYLSPQYARETTYSGYVHNSYMQIWLETGILGFLAVVLFLGTLIKKMIEALRLEFSKEKKILVIALAWGLSAFYFDNLTNMTFLSFDVSLFGWIALAAFCALLNEEQGIQHNKQSLPFKIAMAIALGFGILIFSTQCLRMALTDLNYQKAMNALDRREYPVAYQLLENAKNLSPDNQYCIAGQGILFIKVFGQTQDRQFLFKAEEKFQEAAELSPYYYLNYVMLSKIANELQDKVKTQEYLKKVEKLCPSRYFFLEKELQQVSFLASKKRLTTP